MIRLRRILHYLLWIQLVSINDVITAHIMLQFDGSFRPPKDPGFPTHLLRRIGTAAACLIFSTSSSSGSDEQNNTTIYLGGRIIGADNLANSAEAEYEGLLLGLEKMVDLIQKGNIGQKSNAKILVQGDCKTVIDQMNKLSRPRKLETHSVRCKMMTEQINNSFGKNCEMLFELIPRDWNLLCDGLCTMIRQDFLEKPENEAVLKLIEEATDGSDLSNLLSGYYFGPQSLIVHSKRPFLYHKIAQKALEMEDFEGLIQLGTLMEQEAKTVWMSASVSREIVEVLRSQGLRYQIRGLKGLSTKKSMKEATHMEQKNHFLLCNNLNDDTISFLKLQTVEASHIPQTTSSNLESLWDTWLASADEKRAWEHGEEDMWVKLEMNNRSFLEKGLCFQMKQ